MVVLTQCAGKLRLEKLLLSESVMVTGIASEHIRIKKTLGIMSCPLVRGYTCTDIQVSESQVLIEPVFGSNHDRGGVRNQLLNQLLRLQHFVTTSLNAEIC